MEALSTFDKNLVYGLQRTCDIIRK